MSVLIGLIFVGSIYVVVQKLFSRIEVQEFHKGLLFKNNKFACELAPGWYWINKLKTKVIVFDTREQNVGMSGQELLSLDQVQFKMSLNIRFKVVDTLLAHSSSSSTIETLYSTCHLALRAVVSQISSEELCSSRTKIGENVTQQVKAHLSSYGVEVIEIIVKDVMLPGEIKRIFSDLVKARKEAEANLERARGEASRLRCLANAAKLIEGQPLLLELKKLQVAEVAALSSNNTLEVRLSKSSKSEK